MNYIRTMEFEWDAVKSDACFAERGFDFAYILRAFLDPDRLIRRDARWDYGEDRYQLLGACRAARILCRLRGARGGHSDYFGTQGQPTRGAGL